MIRVLIADDHAVVRQGLKQIIGDTPEMLVAGEATNGQEVLDRVRAETWDVVVLDISMPDRSGLDILKQLRSEQPKLPVLVLSMYSEDQYAIRVLKAGASGYLTKDSAADELVKAIRKVVSGGRYVSSSLAEKLAFEIGADSSRLPHEMLSDREFQVPQNSP
jgi:two-component system, NarL family, invasion response regulator UvrY